MPSLWSEDFVLVVQSPSLVWLFVTPWTSACQAPLSLALSQSLLKLTSIEVIPSILFILCCLHLLLSSIFSSIRVFSNDLALCITWPKYWSFSISPSNEYSGLISFRIDWFDLLAVQGTLKSLLQHHSLEALILWCSAFFLVQRSHLYMTAGKLIALTIWTFVGKVLSLLFNMLSPEKVLRNFIDKEKKKKTFLFSFHIVSHEINWANDRVGLGSPKNAFPLEQIKHTLLPTSLSWMDSYSVLSAQFTGRTMDANNCNTIINTFWVFSFFYFGCAGSSLQCPGFLWLWSAGASLVEAQGFFSCCSIRPSCCNAQTSLAVEHEPQ